MSEYLPENSLFAWVVDDWPSFKEDFSVSPWGEVADFSVWTKISELIEEKWEEKLSQESKRDAKDYYQEVHSPIVESINGGLSMAVGQIEKSFTLEVLKWENESGGKSRWKAGRLPDITFLAESSLSDQEFEEIIDWISARIKSNKIGHAMMEKSLIAGVDIHWLGHAKSEELTKLQARDTMVALAFHKGMFLAMTGGEDHVEETILRIQGKSNSSALADYVPYQDSFDEIEQGQARAFLNFKMFSSWAERMEKVPGFKIPENPFGVTMNGLIDGLGLKGLDHFAMQIDVGDDGFFASQGLFMNERKGMLALFNPVNAEVELYDFSPKDAFGVSSMRYDLAEIWPTVEQTLTSISPGLGLLVNSQIQAFEEQAKLSLREDLFGSMGDEILSLSFLNQSTSGEIDMESPSSTIYAISLKDPDLFDRTLRSLFDAVTQGSDLFKEREHRGVLVRSMRGLEGLGASIGYAVFDQWVLLSMGEARYLNQLLNRMKGAKSSLWDQPQIREVLNDLPSGTRQVDYVNLSQIFPFFSSMLESYESDMKIDLNQQDFGEFPYFMLGWTKDHADGIISKAGLFRIPE